MFKMDRNPQLFPELEEFVYLASGPLSSTDGDLESNMSPSGINSLTSNAGYSDASMSPITNNSISRFSDYIDAILSNDPGYDSSMSPTANNINYGIPWLEITNQPQDLFRFRYLKESKKLFGPLQGLNSEVSKYPQVRLHNFNGEAIIRCWLTEPDSNRPSPHQLVGYDQNGRMTREPHDVRVNSFNNFTANFEKLNIIHAVFSEKDNYFERYKQKYNHINSGLYTPPQVNFVEVSIGDFKKTAKTLASLYFEVFAEENGQYIKIADAKSNRIRDKKNPETSDLKIHRVSSIKGSCQGGDEIFIFVDKIVKGVKVKFYEEDSSGKIIWSDYAKFGDEDIHHQVAIAMKTPPYKDLNVTKDVQVYFKLEKLTKNIYVESSPRPYSYIPLESTLQSLGVKRKRRLPSTISSEVDEPLNEDDIQKLLKEYGLASDSVVVKPQKSLNRLINDLFGFLQDSILKNNEIMFENIFFKCVQAGIDLDERNCYNETLLQIAVQKKNRFFIQKLLQAGSSVETLDKDFNTVLHLAVIHFPECLDLLIKKSSSKIQQNFNRDGDNLLLLGARIDSKKAVEILLEKGWDLDVQNLKTGDTPLHLATRLNHLCMIKLLLKNGADANFGNYSGWTPFHYAASGGRIDILKILFSTGIKLPNENFDENEILCGPNIFDVADAETVEFLKEYSKEQDLKNEEVKINRKEKTEILPIIDSNLELACNLAIEMNEKCLVPVLKSISPRSNTKFSQIIIDYFQGRVADPVAHVEEYFSKLNI